MGRLQNPHTYLCHLLGAYVDSNSKQLTLELPSGSSFAAQDIGVRVCWRGHAHTCMDAHAREQLAGSSWADGATRGPKAHAHTHTGIGGHKGIG